MGKLQSLDQEPAIGVGMAVKELFFLIEVSTILVSTPDVNGALSSVMARLVETVESADSALLFLHDPDSDRLTVPAASGYDFQLLSRVALEPGEGIPGRVFARGRAMLFSSPSEIDQAMADVSERNLFALQRARALCPPPQSAVYVPMTVPGRVLGALAVECQQEEMAFSESTVPLLQTVANVLALAVENARLTRETEQLPHLREADRLKSELISTVTHELRTPLTAIKGYATTLLRKDVQWGQNMARESLEIINEESDKLGELVENLLMTSQIEAGTLSVIKEPVLVSLIARKTVDELAQRGKRHRFVLNFPSPFPVAEGDSRRVRQVLLNLIENAVKYSLEDSQIEIRGEAKEGCVLLSVADQGCGIPPEDLDKVFDMFYRVSNPATQGAGGSGLGLAIARKLVEAQGGRIWVESTPGRGSTFYFTLPLAKALADPERG
jgi:K+-sensing histidine kinase KdpD